MPALSRSSYSALITAGVILALSGNAAIGLLIALAATGRLAL